MQSAEALVRAYYAAFNARDAAGLLALLSEDVAHDINQGGREIGKPAFAAFIERMATHYDETVAELVVLTEPGGGRAAAEFTVLGEYRSADIGMPPARGQRYRLNAGAFFAIRDGKIARVTVYYNLPDWIAQVSG